MLYRLLLLSFLNNSYLLLFVDVLLHKHCKCVIIRSTVVLISFYEDQTLKVNGIIKLLNPSGDILSKLFTNLSTGVVSI